MLLKKRDKFRSPRLGSRGSWSQRADRDVRSRRSHRNWMRPSRLPLPAKSGRHPKQRPPQMRKDSGSARKDQAGAKRAPMPGDRLSRMLAELGKGEPPRQGKDWLYEIKWDGVRAAVLPRYQRRVSQRQRRPAHYFAQWKRRHPAIPRALRTAAPSESVGRTRRVAQRAQGPAGDCRWRNRGARRRRDAPISNCFGKRACT